MSFRALHELWRLNIPSKICSRTRSFRTTTHQCVSYVYNITFETGDKFGAGTDSNVYVRLVGDYGSTEEMKVSTRQKDMERGMTNTYRLATDYVGPLQKLIVRHDSSGIGAAWYLEKVIVRDAKGANYDFPCGSWLSKSSTEDAIKLLRPVQLQNNTSSGTVKPSHPLEKPSNDKPRPPKVQRSASTNQNADVMKTSSTNAGTKSNAKNSKAQHVPTQSTNQPISTFSVDLSTNDHAHAPSTRHALSLSPSVRFLRDTFAIDLNNVVATGPQARVLKGDVLGYMKKENITEPVKFDMDAIKEPVKDAQLADIIMHSADAPVAATVDTNLVSKFHTPHLYMMTSCYLEYFDTHLKTLLTDSNIKEITQAAAITRIFTHTLHLTFDKEKNFDVSVANNGKNSVFVGSIENDFNDIMSALKDQPSSDHSATYVLNMRLAGDGISQLSSVLNPANSLVLNISGEQLRLDKDGKICRTCSLSLTFDGRRITENEAASFLENMKKFIENPLLIGL